jgi:putative hemolysin
MMQTESTPRTVFPPHPDLIPPGTVREGHYEVRFARTREELEAIQRLRFEVFNMELGEGLAESAVTGRDVDAFDETCHHLMVTDLASGAVVGCYRLQTASMADANIGFYSATLFDLASMPADAARQSIELGRACVASAHRSTVVLFLLWKGLAMYITHNRMRFLFGCCSITSQDPAEGSEVLRYLEERGHMHPEWRIQPVPDKACPLVEVARAASKVPKLFRTYLRYGALACGPPAIDREFKTIDYLVVLDVKAISRRTFEMFFG